MRSSHSSAHFDIPESAIDRGELFQHRLWQVGVTDDALAIDWCSRCDRQFIGAINEFCEGAP